jgi:GTP-binding protein Era
VAVNKVDSATPERAGALMQWAAEDLRARPYRVSALTGEGVVELRQDLEVALPLSPFLYPEDDIASQPVRFFVAELVRETIFESYRQEIPYSVVCEVEDFRESEDPVFIRVVIHVERASQKGILVGEGGRAIKQLGALSREKVEHLIGRPVYLDLWVKALPGWRRKRAHLARFGFHVPEEP